jgi:hypothetical protein
LKNYSLLCHDFNKLLTKQFMKKVLLGMFAIGLLTACSGTSPESVATTYLNALKDKDWEKAKSVGTDGTKEYVSQWLETEQLEAGITEVKDVKCTVSEDGKSAECTFCCSDGNKEKIAMIKDDKGNWLVDDSKEMPDLSNFGQDWEDEEWSDEEGEEMDSASVEAEEME